MEYKNIKTEELDNYVLLTINRPKALNALNKETVNELRDFFSDEENKNSETAGVIITGSGEKSFVAGADISEFTELSENEGAEFARNGHEAFNAIENFPKPVVAAVNGFALGGGNELAMACHLRIAGKHAKFGQPEVNLGLIPGYGGTQRLIRLVGRTKAMELLMTADMVDAEEALTLGLINEVVEKGEEVEGSKKMLDKISSKAPLAITEIIHCANRYEDPNEDGFEYEINAFGTFMTTDDFSEGVDAFLNKRKADFKGQ